EELRDQVKQEMINRLVAVQAAEKAGLAEKGPVRQEIELARQGILVRALMRNHLENNPVTDKEIQAEYDKLKQAKSEDREYKVSHILVKEEDKANEIIAAIKADDISFAEAAKQDSIDPGSGSRGGDLGWGPATNYVPEFAKAVENLDKGEMTDEPVESQFGWHIVRVEDARQAQFPELDDVREQIEEMLRQEQLASFQEDL